MTFWLCSVVCGNLWKYVLLRVHFKKIFCHLGDNLGAPPITAVTFISVGVYIINLKKTWEKLLLAARAIVAIENPADVCVISSRNTGQVIDKLCDWLMLAAFVLYHLI